MPENTIHRKQVVAALMIRGEQILICQRTEDQPMPLKWEFPGGKIEPGELPQEALCRELEEELGVQAAVGPEITAICHQYGTGILIELRFYLVEEYAGEIQNRIFQDVRWVKRQDLPAYDFLEADVALIRDLAAGRISLAPQAGRQKPGQPSEE